VVIELDGLLWEPVPGSAVGAEEFIAARSLIREIHESLWWNLWLMTDRAAEYDAALTACGQWTRAEQASPIDTQNWRGGQPAPTCTAAARVSGQPSWSVITCELRVKSGQAA
jgi:hypothetical protein